jgi:hypothetical protein
MFGMSVRNRAADLSAREADVLSLMMLEVSRDLHLSDFQFSLIG